MIAPGYYSQECNVHKPCPDPTKYCHMFLCVDCLKENVACTQNGQCCPGTECTYGRCKKGSSKGAAGFHFHSFSQLFLPKTHYRKDNVEKDVSMVSTLLRFL